MIEFNATLLVCMISFVVFMFIMNIIFYKPISEIINKRENYIKENNLAADSYTQEAKKNTELEEEKLHNARYKCRQVVKSEQEKFHAEADNEIKAAKEKTKENISSAKSQLDNNSQEIKSVLNEQIIDDLAEAIAEKVEIIA